ncbi:MAG: hypothetical protein IAI49_14235, partial [Candidatus Eremiobacteraeota bacterium]|nr:hypothetical protein [Candidatus Eremiobacteraeota bacterium]
ELDSLGVRVTNLEESLDALERRTKLAQSLSLHGEFLPNLSFRNRAQQPTSIANTTGAPAATYYGAVVPGNPGAVGGIDPLVNAYISTDDSNNPLTSNDSGIEIRQDSRFSLAYQIDDRLTVSLPVHILNYEYGGEFAQDAKFDVEPGVDITLARAGALTNLDLQFGIIENMTSSRTGLAFRAPQGYDGSVPYEEPFQPYQKGALVKGTVGEGAFGSTDFEVSFTRVDDTRLDTQTNVTSPNTLPFNANTYFYPVVAPPAGFVQTTPAGVLKTDTFDAGTATLGQVFLTNAAVNGSVYVSSYDGTTYDAAGVRTGGPARPLPAFAFNAAYNDVVFSVPLAPGSVVGITYRDLAESNATTPQRYMTHARFNQRFKGYAGAEVGVTYNRVFDVSGSPDSGSGSTAPVAGEGLVSDTVLGIDAQLPVPLALFGRGAPTLFGEAVHSSYTADAASQAVVGDFAAVTGLKFRLAQVDVSVQYQSVGPNFFSGAPLRYFGNVPQLLASNRLG